MVEKVKTLPSGQGLNAATGEYVDMFKAGIIDPAKVTRSALQNAASIAGLFLTTEAVVGGEAGEDPGAGRPRRRRRYGLLTRPGGSAPGPRESSRAGGLTAGRPHRPEGRPRDTGAALFACPAH